MTQILKDDEFKSYMNSLDELDPERNHSSVTGAIYEFEVYSAKPLFQEHSKGRDFIGVELTENPEGLKNFTLKTIRVPVQVARLHNRQIQNAVSPSGSTFYLLKK